MADPLHHPPRLGHVSARDPQYTDLVRQGAGNEEERLALLRRHQEQVTAQIGQLTQCLELITYKVRVYEDHLDQAAADHPCGTPSEPPGS